jgi:protein involved in polysaccharide export with SLBB domain
MPDVNADWPATAARRRIYSVVHVCALAIGSAAVPADSAAQLRLDTTLQVLKPGDYIRIAVWRKEELSGEFRIGADGTIEHPLYRAVHVADMPLSTAQDRIRTFVLQFETNPQLLVQPLFRVAVAGEVNRPDLFRLAPDVTVAGAIQMAGGYSPTARIAVVKLVRGGLMRELDLRNPVEAATVLQSGDQIIVEHRTSSLATVRDAITQGALVVYGVVLVINALRNH